MTTHALYRAATRYAQQVIAEMAARQRVPGAFCVWPPTQGRIRERVFLVEDEARCARVAVAAEEHDEAYWQRVALAGEWDDEGTVL